MNPYVFFAITFQLLLVAWFDLRQKTISNNWPLINFALSLILYLAFPGGYPFTWNIFLFPIGFIVIGFLLFLMGIMGAGDSKYLASLFLIIPYQYHFAFFEKLLLTTIIVGGLLLILKVLRNFSTLRAYLWSHHWKGLKETIRSRFSYAPVIFLAWIALGALEWK
jgi:prepilin peptidase CpaA